MTAVETVLNFMNAVNERDADKLAAIAPGMKHFVDEQQICGAVLLVGTSQGVSYLKAVGNQSEISEQFVVETG